VTDPSLLRDLLSVVEPGERGDPMSPLRWTCKSLRRLAAEMASLNSFSLFFHQVGDEPHRATQR
jgi:hypothetical protein